MFLLVPAEYRGCRRVVDGFEVLRCLHRSVDARAGFERRGQYAHPVIDEPFALEKRLTAKDAKNAK